MSRKPRDRSTPTQWPVLLCIDDDPHISETIGLRLRHYQVDVLSAYHGMQGFWLAMTERPGLIITDVRMPQGGGDYVVECLRNNSDTREIPVIVLTGQRDLQLQSQMQRLGVEEYLVKPVPFEELAAAISRYIPLEEFSSRELEPAGAFR